MRRSGHYARLVGYPEVVTSSRTLAHACAGRHCFRVRLPERHGAVLVQRPPLAPIRSKLGLPPTNGIAVAWAGCCPRGLTLDRTLASSADVGVAESCFRTVDVYTALFAPIKRGTYEVFRGIWKLLSLTIAQGPQDQTSVTISGVRTLAFARSASAARGGSNLYMRKPTSPDPITANSRPTDKGA